MKIAILGRPEHIANYTRFLSENGLVPHPTLCPQDVCGCDGLLLPGGGDIAPCFYGVRNKGAVNIDIELDILQFQALELCIQARKPVLGICKGMQLLNVAFGGTLLQDMPTAHLHKTSDRDLYHAVCFTPDAVPTVTGVFPSGNVSVNSCHHQCLLQLGHDLLVCQYCPADQCVEAISHRHLPILGVQWHPERLDPAVSAFPAASVLSVFSARFPRVPAVPAGAWDAAAQADP
ncbi:MAG: gamma-glutamyl-gamma-aminobutyrate hydrolase family protein [Lachnospiraceae bacterium]|nr:gamma-glutamyl-gamma-aminobutyrate hydrolase family protein [Lachnospiraceae bacterium]